MGRVTTPQGVRLEYEGIGEESGEPMLLIQGLGAQLIGWRREFCELLASYGFRVIRFDNRDSGLSEKFPHGGYEVANMADDAAGLLEGLAIERAHIVGQSLGGMIAQELALRHPERITSLGLVYSAPNARHFSSEHDLPNIATRRPASTREQAIRRYVEDESFCVSQAYEFDTAWIRELGGLMWDRCYCPAGVQRQLEAVLRSRDRRAALTSVRVPTVIIHGDADRIIDLSGGQALADAIPNADLRIVPGMGHELPRRAWPELVEALAENAHAARLRRGTPSAAQASWRQTCAAARVEP
jgi:pimeloyl-ACP methyl ester carboxylesterase